MLTLIALTVAIAAGLAPLLQRDIRLAHARIQARRRWARLTPLQQSILAAVREFNVHLGAFGRAMSEAGASYQRAMTELRKANQERGPWRS